jgi:hypothetical protein
MAWFAACIVRQAFPRRLQVFNPNLKIICYSELDNTLKSHIRRPLMQGSLIQDWPVSVIIQLRLLPGRNARLYP